MTLQGKRIIVAGGCGLIGRAVVDHLMGLGAEVRVCDTKLEDHYGGDLSEERHVKNLFWNASPVDGFVNCTYPKDPREHFDCFALCTWEATRRLREGGSVVNFSSVYGGVQAHDPRRYEGTEMYGPDDPWEHFTYAAVKGAIVSMTRTAAIIGAPRKIRANCISPGGVFDHQDPKFVLRYEADTPLKRMATPQDIVGAVAFLLSDESSYITGANLIVDGGITLL